MTRRYGIGPGARGDEPVDLSYVHLEAETGSAWLLVFREKTAKILAFQAWMPKSQCDLDVDRKVVVAPRWLVEKNGLEDFAE